MPLGVGLGTMTVGFAALAVNSLQGAWAEVTDRGEVASDLIAALLELSEGLGDGHGGSPYLK